MSSTPSPKLTVISATDRHYVELAGVMLKSLALSSSEAVGRVVVFGDGLGAADEVALAECYPSGGFEIRRIDRSSGDDLLRKLPIRSHMTRSTYVKLLVPRLVPNISGRILVLDSDIVVNGDIGPLAHIDLTGYPLAAVADAATEKVPLLNARIGSPPDTPYLNAGVLLFDREGWEAARLTEKTLEYLLSQGRRIQLLDQDALNFVLRGNWKRLDRTWNFLEPSKEVAGRSRDPFAAARVIHFVGRIKPNDSDCPHPARDIYLKFRALTPWADKPLGGPIRRNLRIRLNRMRYSFARAFGDAGVSP